MNLWFKFIFCYYLKGIVQNENFAFNLLNKKQLSAIKIIKIVSNDENKISLKS